MTAEPLGGSDLMARVSQAIRGYETNWKLVDSELYNLCRRRHRHDDFQDVYTKVAIVGRTYEAGVARSWRGKGDPETEITRVLIEQADLIRSGLQRLEGVPFDRQIAGEIVALHGGVTRAISHRSGDRFLASFVSKYLHFHSPIVPIYDSNAHAAISSFVDQELAKPIREMLTALPDWTRAYRNFVAAFVVLFERVYSQTTLCPSVKELDHLLWQPL